MQDHAGQKLDRHALVMAVWLAVGFPALGLFHYGFGAGGPIWLAAGFAAVLTGYLGHVIVNASVSTDFSTRELALGLVVMAAALLALVFAVLLLDGFAARFFLPVTAGLAAVVAVVVLTMLIRHGPRRAFAVFDVIRDNNRRPASLLPHKGGRK